jgi:predicted nucleic acid-binding protein
LTRLLLDTAFLVDADRSKVSLDHLIADDDEVAIAAITVAELLVGVLLADDAHRADRQQFVEEVRETIPIVDYDASVAADDLWEHPAGNGRSVQPGTPGMRSGSESHTDRVRGLLGRLGRTRYTDLGCHTHVRTQGHRQPKQGPRCPALALPQGLVLHLSPPEPL